MSTRWRPVALASMVLLTALSASAQTIYRIVGADGKVTFSDQPPSKADNVTAHTANGRPIAARGSTLPYVLRDVAAKYPVVLYTAPDCTPCTNARAMLNSRGIPFAEKTVTTNDDIAALSRIAGDGTLPFLTIGGQHLKGFSDTQWDQFLTVAGYPLQSVLPGSYRNPPATALVEVQKASPKAESKPSPPGLGTRATL